MTGLNESHDPARRSWIEQANTRGSEFPIQNLPLGVFRAPGRDARGGDLQRLLDDLRHKAWQHGRDDADLANAIWCDPYQRRACLAQRRVARLG